MIICRDLTGYVFNNITVIYKCDYKKGKYDVWHCQCNCSEHNEFDLTTEQIDKKIIYNCGCVPVEPRGIKHNLLGQRFHKLIVRSYVGHSCWLCKCDCGNFKVLKGQNLMHNEAKSCGKCIPHYDDLTNMRFGNLVVKQLVRVTSDNRPVWECICDCGRKVERLAKTLKRADVVHKCDKCLCDDIAERSRMHIEGQTFGELTVEKFAFVYQERTYWKCRCSCGKLCIVRGKELTRGLIKSCKHLKHRCGKDNPNFIDITGNTYGILTALEHIEGKKWRFLCHNCGNDDFVAVKRDVAFGRTTNCGCMNIRRSGSLHEREILQYIYSLCPYVPSKETSILGRKEIDIYYTDLHLGIEYNGSAYHASEGAVHKDANKPINYHRDKFLCAKEKGIHLITIFDVDWQTKEKAIKMYLCHLFLQSFSVGARKCLVKEVDIDEANAFICKYSVYERSSNAPINYGLFKDDLLLAVMTFDFIDDNTYCLQDYCVKAGYVIVGGANKLLSYFERVYLPKHLVSYSDNDFFSGNIHIKLGFSYAGQVNPNYYWFYGQSELNPDYTELSYLKENEPELYKEAIDNNVDDIQEFILIGIGARKVYRCGNTKWEKHYN